jgi:hypothetical protein
MDTTSLTTLQLTTIRADALDRVLEFGLQRDDVNAWRVNMDASVAWITCDLMSRRIILHAKLTLESVVEGIQTFPLDELHDHIELIPHAGCGLQSPGNELDRIRTSVRTAIDAIRGLALYAATGYANWPDSYIDMICSLCKNHEVPNLAEVRRFRETAMFKEDTHLVAVAHALHVHAAWLNEILPTIFEYCDAFEATDICRKVTNMKLGQAKRQLRRLELAEGKQQATAELAAKELETRATDAIFTAKPPSPDRHPFNGKRLWAGRPPPWRIFAVSKADAHKVPVPL